MSDKPVFTSVQPMVDALMLKETIEAKVIRADGSVENMAVQDLIVTAGRTYLAKRIAGGDSVASAMAYMAVGTVTTAATLNNTTLSGEVGRKGLAVNSTVAGDNVYSAVATWGGAADSITSLALTEAAITNHASSGQGTMFQRITFAAVTLANSDFFHLTMNTNVGSS